MLKKTLILTIFITNIVVLAGCSSFDEPNQKNGSQISSIEVVKLKNYLPNTRGKEPSIGDDELALKLRDREQYDSLLNELRRMSEKQRLDYFNQIGFNGAYSIMKRAEEDLDDIFNAVDANKIDSVQMDRVIKCYRENYAGIFDFSTEDLMDDTPYFKFVDENAELIGSMHGYVIVGEELIHPEYTTSSAPYAGKFVTYRKSEVKLSGRGGYNSYFHLGKVGKNLAFKVVTYKQRFAHKSFDKRCVHTGALKVVGQKASIDSKFRTIGAYCTTKVLLSDMSPYMNLTLTDFSCSRYPDKKVSKTINNILVN